MSNEHHDEEVTKVSVRSRVRVNVERLRASRQRSSILGMAEIIALASAGLLCLVALIAYFYLLVPQRARLENARAERQRLETKLRDATEGVTRNANTQASVEEILASLQDFETSHLLPRSEGSTAIIGELNRLINRNNLRISTGITFTQLDEVVAGAPPRSGGQGARVVQSVFPGIGVNLTVEGSYANLRRFIHNVEAERQFIVIDAIQLEGVTDTSAARSPFETGPGAQSAPAARGTLVSLRLEMATYFRRSATPQETSFAGDEATR